MRMRFVLVVACASGFIGCSDSGTGPGSELQISTPSRQVVEGREMTLAVSAGGRPVASRDVEWSSSDPTTLSVRDGVVRGVAPGVAFVRAGQGLTRDSVAITVRFAQAATAGMAIRIAGTNGEVVRMRGAGMIIQPIGLTNSHMQLRASNSPVEASLPQAGMGDSLLFINMPGPIEIGEFELHPLIVEWPLFHFTDGSGAFFRIRDSGSRLRFYAPVTPPQLEITSIQMPEEAGSVPGLITGSIAFEAAGLVADVDETFMPYLAPLGDTTVRVYAEFVTPIYHILTPRISASLEGGPDAGTMAAGGGASIDEGGLNIWLSGYPASSGEEITRMFQASVWVPAPAVGTTNILAADASVLIDSTGAPHAWARVSTMSLDEGRPGAPLHAFSESGTISITSYTPPSRTGFGRVEGEVTATLRYPPDASVQGTTVLRTRFLLPLNPLDGHPLAPPR